MAGVKGRSGRKSTTEEYKRLKIIEKAWEVAYEVLCNPSLDISEKVKVAVPIVVKDIKDKGEYTHKIEHTPQEIEELNNIRNRIYPNSIHSN